MISKFPRRPSAFTLIELLTVIAIIAILMGLLFPALSAVRENARRVQAKNEIAQISAAVKQYYAEYGKYPPLEDPAKSTSSSGTPKDQWVGDTTQAKTKVENSMLFNTLRGRDSGINVDNLYNPRRIPFFEGKTVSNPEVPKGGFLNKLKTGGTSPEGMPKSEGCLLDPWGRQYFIMIDTNFDNLLDVSELYTDFADADRPRGSVAVFSMGKDNKIGDALNFEGTYRQGTKTSDDIISWQ